MKLFDILKKVGGGIIKTVIPGSGIISVVNEILTGDDKLSDDATGDDVSRAISSLPSAERTQLLNREFDVKIEKLKTIQTMLTADAMTPHTTRPYIAKQSFHVVALVTIAIIGMWSYGVGTANAIMIKAIMEGWPFILAVTAPLVVILQAYFGVLKSEQKNKLDASNGISQPSGIAGFIGNLIKGR